MIWNLPDFLNRSVIV